MAEPATNWTPVASSPSAWNDKLGLSSTDTYDNAADTYDNAADTYDGVVTNGSPGAMWTPLA